MKTEWNLRPRAHQCLDCNQPFQRGAGCHSRLSFRDGAWNRVDVCGDCAAGGPAPPDVVSAWKWVYQPPEPTPERLEPVRRETGETMLRRLVDSEDLDDVNVIYVLAILLERAKILIERDVRRSADGLLLRLYEHRRSGEMFRIRDPGLRLDALQAVQTEVLRRLDGRAEDAAESCPPQPPARQAPGPAEGEDGVTP